MAMYLKRSLLALVSMAFASLALAENPPASSQSQQESPHQRHATKQEGTEAMSTSDTDPAASSTPHQKETTRTATTKAEQERMMKDCVDQAQSRDSSMSKDQAKKSCMEQMKSSQRTGG
jgi:hypothetical protein